jgi:hypothetical protein
MDNYLGGLFPGVSIENYSDRILQQVGRLIIITFGLHPTPAQFHQRFRPGGLFPPVPIFDWFDFTVWQLVNDSEGGYADAK